MKHINAKSVLRSAERLVQAEDKFKETRDPAWLWFLKIESSILARRAIKIWFKIRFRR